MTDEEFLRALEGCTLSESEFGHHAHVRAGYLYLRKSNFAEALARMRRSLCAYATHLGRPDRYHETITTAYLALIQQCMVACEDQGCWASFSRRNPELFNPALLSSFYDREVLESTLARRVFLLPGSNPIHGKGLASNGEPTP